MHRVFRCLVLIFIATMALGCPDDDDENSSNNSAGTGGGQAGEEGEPSASTMEQCMKFCTTEASLGCPMNDMADCIDDCNEFIAETPAACETEANELLACMAALKVSAWECNVEGDADTKEGVCADENAANETCLAAE